MLALVAAQRRFQTTVSLPSSKSESNRAIIIQALSRESVTLTNLSEARDTRTMLRLLESEGHVLDVIDAGTTMRFLTAFFAAVGRDQILTGTPRMCQRPIGLLVDDLRSLGAEIAYWNQEGFPPLHIISKGQQLRGGDLQMAGNVSSQFISAILLIAPTLPGGLRLELTGEITSRPYIYLTLRLMEHFGVKGDFQDNIITVAEQPYTSNSYSIESDWSAASYWYSFAALSESADILLKGLRADSWQGDQSIARLMEHFGIHTVYTDEGARITKTEAPRSEMLECDLRDFPDLAQTLAVVSAGTGTPIRMSGLHTLRVKETDRIEALRTELGKFGVEMTVEGDTCTITGKSRPTEHSVETYEDHRMAMAFAPMALLQPQLLIRHHEVVEKSYPSFWQHVEQAHIRLTEW